MSSQKSVCAHQSRVVVRISCKAQRVGMLNSEELPSAQWLQLANRRSLCKIRHYLTLIVVAYVSWSTVRVL